MNKSLTVLSFVLLLASFSIFSACNNSDKNEASFSMNPENLPANSKNFVSEYFTDATIIAAEQSPNKEKDRYTILLNNNIEIDFDVNGNWTNVESKNRHALPENFLSKEAGKINDYVKTNFPNNFIIDLEKESYGFSAELNNSADIRFDHDQNFLGLDSDNRSEIAIQLNELPEAAKVFVNTYFIGAEYRLIKREIENNITEYEVYLSNNFNIDFDANGTWTSIDSKGNTAIPSAIILPAIQNYVSSNYSGYSITSIEKKINVFEVEIKSNNKDIDLNFDLMGNFLGIDY